MEYKLLEKQDLGLMIDFIDDEKTKYDIDSLKRFIENENNFGFIVKEAEKIIAFAVGYLLEHPDGKKSFYLDSIDVIMEYQNKGCGANLMIFIRDYVKGFDCYEMFLITNRSNISACKCYEKTGGKSEAEDDVVFVYDLKNDCKKGKIDKKA